MKAKDGHIRIIDNEVIFEYYELEKPELICRCSGCLEIYEKRIVTYEASKRLIEVSNVKRIHWLYFFYFGSTIVMHPDYELKDGQACKAEIIGKTATITELIK